MASWVISVFDIWSYGHIGEVSSKQCLGFHVIQEKKQGALAGPDAVAWLRICSGLGEREEVRVLCSGRLGHAGVASIAAG